MTFRYLVEKEEEKDNNPWRATTFEEDDLGEPVEGCISASGATPVEALSNLLEALSLEMGLNR